MITMLRRLFWLALIGGAGYAAYTAWQTRQAETTPAAPEWPPIDPPESSGSDSTASDTTTVGFVAVPTETPDVADDQADDPAPAPDAAGSTGTRWVEPLPDGSCPDGYPVKANDNSGIFHLPGGRFYNRTGAERCYARAEDAEADGYRAAKS